MPVSTFSGSDALTRGMSFGPVKQPVMEKSRAVAADTSGFSAEQVADLLAVVMWSHNLLVDEIAAMNQHARPHQNVVVRLNSLLLSVRPVADTRRELARLDGALLLDGFALWAARQRSVMNRLVASSLGRE